ncbi:hypothetical protein RRG08_015094 [Elysia crispata]|uniref:Succinate dehydrogenase cytochrome b560 subunit, mitochondrial n=1 Tax=Elysia crispata TaxID=231223 RepID=A0AAE1EAR3_9GAST|nr:hypothetical protein RRG08_015094 [Elysia crispata]
MIRIPVCRQLVQHCLLRSNASTVTARSTMSTRITAYEEMNNYWAKNKKLNRPLSPHLTVYKFHLTMAISIANRVTASAQQAILTGAPILLVCLPGDFHHYFNAVRDMDIPSPVIYGLKFLVAFPFAFHLMAGLRHLVWDAGAGFGKNATLKGGWVIVAGTVALTALMMLYKSAGPEEKR